MNEKLTIADLAERLATKHSMDEQDAEAFVKEFFLLIEQALENEKVVKIKGWGTFRLVDMDERESVNINTGERFQIKNYTKVAFIPDAGLRETINKPFAHFETVVLNDNTVLEDTPVEEMPAEEVSAEEADEEKTLTAEETASPTEEEKTPVAETMVPTDEARTSVVETMAPTEEKVADTVEEMADTERPEVLSSDERKAEPVVAEVTATTETMEAAETMETVVGPAENGSKGAAPSDETDRKKEPTAALVTEEVFPKVEKAPVEKEDKSLVSYLIAVVVAVLVACGGMVGYLYFPDWLGSFDNDGVEPVQTVSSSVPEDGLTADTLARDSVPAMVANDTLPATETAVPPVAKEKKDENVPPAQPSPVAKETYSESVAYTITGTKARHTVKAGETLTKISLRYYGTKAMWPYIVKHNVGVIKNPDNVPYGTVIKIPELAKK